MTRFRAQKAKKLPPPPQEKKFIFVRQKNPYADRRRKREKLRILREFHSKKMNFSRVSGDWAKRHRCITLGSGVYHWAVYHRSNVVSE